MDESSLENQFLDALREQPPNFEKAETLLRLGADLNAALPEYANVLSTLILGYPGDQFCRAGREDCDEHSCLGCGQRVDGRYLPQIIRFCLDHGFDVTRDNGTAGVRCLETLSWSSCDDHILESAKILLDAGVDPEADPHPDETEMVGYKETVYSWFGSKANGEVMCCNDQESANRFCVMYDIVDAARNGRDYHKIWNCYHCIGKQVLGVTLCCEADVPGAENCVDHVVSAPAILSCEEPAVLRVMGPYCPPASIVFDCEGLPLRLYDQAADLYVEDPGGEDLKEQVKASSPVLTRCIGRRIVEIRITPQGPDDTRPRAVKVRFDDGSVLRAIYKNGRGRITLTVKDDWIPNDYSELKCTVTEWNTEKTGELFPVMHRLPPNLDGLRRKLSSGRYTPEDIARAAMAFLERDCYFEEAECGSSQRHTTYLYELMELLLEFGLDPNAQVDGSYIMEILPLIHNGADSMALLLDHGGDLNKEQDGKTLFESIDFRVLFDAYEMRDRQLYDALVRTWLVCLGHGARLSGGEDPVILCAEPAIYEEFGLPMFALADLRDHRRFYFGLTDQPCRGGSFTIHIFDRTTGWEVAHT